MKLYWLVEKYDDEGRHHINGYDVDGLVARGYVDEGLLTGVWVVKIHDLIPLGLMGYHWNGAGYYDRKSAMAAGIKAWEKSLGSLLT